MSMVDMPGTFLTEDMDEEVIMVMWESPEELKAKNDPSIYRNLGMI